MWGRPSVNDLWHDLRAVTSEIRPDWDLSTPGLREAWNVGDLARFHGWNELGATKAPSAAKRLTTRSGEAVGPPADDKTDKGE